MYKICLVTLTYCLRHRGERERTISHTKQFHSGDHTDKKSRSKIMTFQFHNKQCCTSVRSGLHSYQRSQCTSESLKYADFAYKDRIVYRFCTVHVYILLFVNKVERAFTINQIIFYPLDRDRNRR